MNNVVLSQQNILNFEKEDIGQIRIIEQNGDIWFVAKDVCDILGYVDTEVALRKLDDDEKLIRKIYVSGQHRNVWLINESGLYTLILRSNKPNAKKFRKWITSEVIPEIRKKGYYFHNEELKKEIINAFIFLQAKNFDKKFVKLRKYLCLGLSDKEIKKLIDMPLEEINKYKELMEKAGLIKKVKSTLTPVEEYCLFPELVNWNKIEKIKEKILEEKSQEIAKKKIVYQRKVLLNEFNIAVTILSEKMKDRAKLRIN